MEKGSKSLAPLTGWGRPPVCCLSQLLELPQRVLAESMRSLLENLAPALHAAVPPVGTVTASLKGHPTDGASCFRLVEDVAGQKHPTGRNPLLHLFGSEVCSLKRYSVTAQSFGGSITTRKEKNHT